MAEQEYVCVSEYGGCKIGTLYEIADWQAEENIALLLCEYYKLGDKLEIKDLFK